MLASVPGNKKAIGQHYNVCSDRAITFTGITKAVGKALGKVWRVFCGGTCGATENPT